MSNLRLISSRIVHDVTEGRSLSECLSKSFLLSLKDNRDRAFVQAVCYGICRFYTRLDFVLSLLLEKPMNDRDSDVHALLLVGLYQLMFMRIPDYAAVTETVNATEKLKKPWARGLVNAILRGYLRRREEIEREIPTDLEAHYAHPEWWIKALKTAWPQHWESILNANNAHPPFALRVNQQHGRREQYLEKLQQADHAANIIPQSKNGIILDEPIHAEDLPGFAEGEVSVQDGAAQLAVELLQLAPQQRVLDACAAPGGKLCHILESQSDLSAVIAVEKDQGRMSSITENLARLKLQAQCICQDVNEVDKWWDGESFDRILLDAPCSASGVVRRHPDIKLLRYPSDIKTLTIEQMNLLSSLWSTLKPGGLFLYVTCSIFPQENVQVIKQFLAGHDDADEEKIIADWGVACDIGRQILPGMEEMDGFYYALLRKKC
jgi:16S rRNA (cytosine967-C5)-methyltransferase